MDAKQIAAALAAPFDPEELKLKPQAYGQDRARALAVVFVDARVVMDRLDDVLGVDGWQDQYAELPDGSVKCRLSVRIGGEWIAKEDVGGQSEQPDDGDKKKAAFSDAIKRAAVKWGVGRYLYSLGGQWLGWDDRKKQFTQRPTLPKWAVPAPPARPPAALTAAAGQTLPQAMAAELPDRGDAYEPPAKAPPKSAAKLPANGAELQDRLEDYELQLVADGVCARGELFAHVIEAGAKAGFGEDMTKWPAPGIALAAKETRAFEAKARKAAAGRTPARAAG